MKFDQLIECNMWNIFVEKSYTKCAGETLPRLLSKKPKLSISLDQYWKVLNSLFLLYTRNLLLKKYCLIISNSGDLLCQLQKIY